MSNHPMGYTRPSQILMKLGIHVVWEPTAPNPKFEANRTSGVGYMAPPTLRVSAKMGVVANL